MSYGTNTVDRFRQTGVQHPAVLLGLDPLYAVSYLAHDGLKGFAVLGGVFLCVTGAEALYADMGHFGAKPIRLAWSAVVFPSLVLNYAGQAAIVLDQGVTADNIFYRLCPAPLPVPMIVFATLATVIASQSIITGAFSMTRQAIQLGWFPRLKITQTSAVGYGQIYVGPVNWMLMLVTIALTIGFGKSDNLAAAYGIAVSATMLMTSALLLIAMREIWQWSLVASIGVAGVFLVIDAAFLVSNSLKIVDGGYVPLLLAGAVYSMMFIWHRGAVTERIHESLSPSWPRWSASTFPACPAPQCSSPRNARHATGAGLARSPQARPPAARPSNHDGDRAGSLDRRRGTRDGHGGGAGLLAHHCPLRLYGAAGYSPPARAAREARLHYRSRRRNLLRRTRDGDETPRWQGPAALAGGIVRRHGAKCRTRDGFLQLARRAGRRDRTADFDLRNVFGPRLGRSTTAREPRNNLPSYDYRAPRKMPLASRGQIRFGNPAR
jgi:K+ potassium transporter